MSAQPVERGAHPQWSPDPVRLRLANYTIEDVLTLRTARPGLS